MTIKIPQPSMALNAESIENYPTPLGPAGIYQTFEMWNTWKVAWDTPVDYIIHNVAVVADSAPDHYLRVVVINAHGSAASIALGKKIRSLNPLFSKWKDRVANIWLSVCKVAATKEPEPFAPDDETDGNLLCSGLAKMTGAYVVASSDGQSQRLWPLPWGHVPDWEGPVFRYEPEHGRVDWHKNYDDPMTLRTPPPIAMPPRFRAFMGGQGSFWKEPRERPWWQWHPSQSRRLPRGVPW